MRSRRRITAGALACVLGLVAAACGDDDSTNTAATTTAAPSVTTTASTGGPTTSTGGASTTSSGGSTTSSGGTTTSSGGTTTSSGGTTTSSGGTTTSSGGTGGGDVSGFGSSKAIGGGKYGQDPSNKDTYKGAGDFELDMTKCPSDYDPVQGISASEIKLAISLPKSGAFAGFGLLSDGMKSYFDYVNKEYKGIDGRKITLDVKDDNYEPARTKNNVDELLQANQYAAFIGVLGTANNLGVWDEINQECMPQLLNATGAVQWGDVEGHPWTTGMQIDYYSEASLWAEWIKKEFPGGANVAAITYNNDFGKSYDKGFKDAIKDTNIKMVKEEVHDANTPNLTNQFTSLASSNADVLLIETSGTFCTQSMAEIEKGSWKPKVMMSATCASLSQFFKPLIDQGLTGNDTYLLQYIKDPNEAANANDPFMQLFKKVATEQGLDSKQTTYFTGWLYGWYMVEFLKLATTFEGGLTRPNILIANRSIDTRFPGLIEGLTNKMEGSKDAYLNEGAHVVQYKITDPKAFGAFTTVSETFNNEGKLGNYDKVKG